MLVDGPLLAQAHTPDLWFLFLWAQDAKVWAFILSFTIGLVGAAVGGWFTPAANRGSLKEPTC